jgi:hypothetical protein
MDLETFMEKQFPDINFLSVATTDFIPGIIIQSLKNPQVQGHTRSVVTGEAADFWEVKKVQGDILAGDKLKGNSKLQSGASLLGILHFSGSAAKEFEYNYSIGSITAMNFKNASKLELLPRLRTIKNTDKVRWNDIKKYFLVTETFYASAFKISFSKNGKMIGKAELKNSLKVNANVEAEIGESGEITVSNNSSVPFGFWAFKIGSI